MKSIVFIFCIMLSAVVCSSPVRSALGAERNKGTKPMPYDAELEFIESTGTQYIDTGLWFTDDTQLECVMSEGSDLSSLSTGGGGAVTGSTINGYGQYWRFIGYSKNTNGNFYWDGNVLCNGSFITCTMDSARKVYRDGSYVFDACVEGYHNVENQFTRMYIFAQLISNTINPRLYKVKSFKIIRGGEIIVDAYAVRFTNENGETEGAMYDIISGMFFRNQGTGAFLIGPDL